MRQLLCAVNVNGSEDGDSDGAQKVDPAITCCHRMCRKPIEISSSDEEPGNKEDGREDIPDAANHC